MLLETHGLSARYGDFQALFDVDFAAGEGEVVAIVGANGAGKSSLLLSLTGVISVDRPSVVFAGEAIGGLPSYEVVTRGITLVPEGRRLFSSLSVEENLLMGAYGGRHGDWDLAQIYRLFPRLDEYRHRAVTALSGGEQQMVAIGRALMSNPRLLLCDELSLGLAPKVIGSIYATLAEVKRRGISLIIVEQNVQQAMAVADRLYCLQAGRISLTGRPRDLTQDEVSHAYFGHQVRQ